MTSHSSELAALAFNLDWFKHQEDVFRRWALLENMCVYYPTGKGKTKIMLTCMYLRGVTEVLVIAPPSTHDVWEADGKALGIKVEAISHARFRMKDTILSRKKATIADEFHLFGGQTGKGWKKFDTFAAGLTRAGTPLIIGSATPNYNDAERVYCVAHSLDAANNRGGYPNFLLTHCKLQASAHSSLPEVTGFHHYKDAEEFLASLPYVVYLPDDAPDILVDVDMARSLPTPFETLGYDGTRHRLMASQMEKRHRKRYLQIVNPVTGLLHDEVHDKITEFIFDRGTPIMIYADHSTIAKAVWRTLVDVDGADVIYIDGETSKKTKLKRIQEFRDSGYPFLVGTATLATGTDGLDRVCDTMVIVDDTSDNSLRRQLVGRILPRGASVNYADKQAFRFTYDDLV